MVKRVRSISVQEQEHDFFNISPRGSHRHQDTENVLKLIFDANEGQCIICADKVFGYQRY